MKSLFAHLLEVWILLRREVPNVRLESPKKCYLEDMVLRKHVAEGDFDI